MAKNLQSVLNSVVNDLLQEDGMNLANAQGQFMRPSSYADSLKNNVDVGLIPDDLALKAQLATDPDLNPAPPATPMDMNLLIKRRQEAIADPTLDSIDAGGESPIDSPYKRAMFNMKHGWENTPDWVKYLGAGLGGSALAAGAGALYLRKKQREANRRAGR